MALATELMSVGAEVDWPDSEAGSQVRDRLTGDPALGHLAGLAEWTAEVLPHGVDPARTALVVVGGAVSAAVDHAAADLGITVRAAEAGDGPDEALAAGVALGDELADTGVQLLLAAVPGVAADAAVAVSVLTNTEPAKVLARGVAATDPEAWMALATEVRDRRRECMTHRSDPDALLASLGSARVAFAAGLLLQSAVRRTPVVIDGPVALAAALVAYESQPRAVRWWGAADEGADPLQRLTLVRLGRRPVLGLGTSLGDGLAGVLSVPVLRVAARIAAESVAGRNDDETGAPPG